MTNKTLAFIDIETTGRDVLKHEVIEIGCVLVRDTGSGHEIKDEFEIKIKPEHIETAEPEALRVNGYNESEWLFATTLEQAIKTLAEKTKDAVMVAHNVGFDYSFLAVAFAKTEIENQMFYANLDTISLAVAKLGDNPAVKRYTLRSLCEYFGIRNERAHTALADARATFEIYKKLMEI